jgi:hypothetical protein
VSGEGKEAKKRVAEIACARAVAVFGMDPACFLLFWILLFLNLWQLGHVDSCAAQTRAFEEQYAAAVAEEGARLRSGVTRTPEDAAAAAAASMRLLEARAVVRDPSLDRVLRWVWTVSGNRVISFISEEGYEVQMVQQTGSSYAANWKFVTTMRHGARPLYVVAYSTIVCYRAAFPGRA